MYLSFVFYRFRIADIEMWTTSCSDTREFTGFRIHQNGEEISPDHLLLVRSNDTKQMAAPSADCSAIIYGMDCDPSLADETGCLHNIPDGSICVKSSVPLETIVNLLNRIFDEYRNFEIMLDERDCSLNELMNSIHDAFCVSAGIIGKDFEGIAVSDDMTEMGASYNSRNQEAATRAMLLSDEFRSTLNTHGVFAFENRFFGDRTMRMLCYDLRVQDDFYGRFYFLYARSEFDNLLAPSVERIALTLEHGFLDSDPKSRASRRSEGFDNAMRAIIAGEPLSDWLDLDRVGWHKNGLYQVGCFRFNSRLPLELGQDYVCNQIETRLGECFAQSRNNEIICVWNQSGTITAESDREHQNLARFLVEFVCKVGISNVFEALSDAPLHLRQAEWALELGEQKDEMFWSYQFKDYALDYILSRATSEFPFDDLTLPQLKILRERDQEKGSELFRTLETYVRLKCNGQGTARELFIHRTTFLYRMKVIRELTGLDIEDETVYERLMISFALYRRAGIVEPGATRP